MRKLIALSIVCLAALGGGVATSTAIRPESNYEKAKRIVYAVFPSDTESAALRVVGCETGHTYSEWSYNSSGASGYFQILRGNGGRVFYYRGKRFVLDSRYLFRPWYNTTAAYFMSKGGHDWHEWVCQP